MFAFFFTLLGGQRNRESLSSWGFFVLGRDGRSQKPLSKGHLISWNNMDRITGWMYRQILAFKQEHNPVSQVCTELKHQAEIPLHSHF